MKHFNFQEGIFKNHYPNRLPGAIFQIDFLEIANFHFFDVEFYIEE